MKVLTTADLAALVDCLQSKGLRLKSFVLGPSGNLRAVDVEPAPVVAVAKDVDGDNKRVYRPEEDAEVKPEPLPAGLGYMDYGITARRVR